MSKEKGKKNISGKKTPGKTLKEKRAAKKAKRSGKERMNIPDIKTPLKTLAEKKVVKGAKVKKK
jgi:hypothetical protein